MQWSVCARVCDAQGVGTADRGADGQIADAQQGGGSIRVNRNRLGRDIGEEDRRLSIGGRNAERPVAARLSRSVRCVDPTVRLGKAGVIEYGEPEKTTAGQPDAEVIPVFHVTLAAPRNSVRHSPANAWRLAVSRFVSKLIRAPDATFTRRGGSAILHRMIYRWKPCVGFLSLAIVLFCWPSLVCVTATSNPTHEAIEAAVACVKPSLVRIQVVATQYYQGREIKYEASGSGVIITKE